MDPTGGPAIALAVCLLLDDRADTAVRGLWQRLEAAGVPTLLSHTHGRHLAHLTYASLRSYDLDAVTSALTALPESEPLTLHLDGFGTFRRSRCWLAPAVTPGAGRPSAASRRGRRRQWGRPAPPLRSRPVGPARDPRAAGATGRPARRRRAGLRRTTARGHREPGRAGRDRHGSQASAPAPGLSPQHRLR